MTSNAPDRDRWDRVSVLFQGALELPPDRREAFLLQAAEGDEELLTRVHSLLRAHEEAEAGEDRLAGLGSGMEEGMAAGLLRWDRAVPPHGASSSSFGPEPGDRVGRYRIIRKLGQGGMGGVFQAHDPLLERTVALKFLSPLPDDGARILEEARAASSLDHPGIGTVFEVGEDDCGRPFIAMASYEGGTLRDRMRGGPLPVEEAVEITAQVADALDAAHSRGIIHRDIKPENLLFDAAGRVKVVDFGIALSHHTSPTQTSAGGTFAYMSPEQLEGDPPDARSDLWALGVVLFEMLAGRHPFHGEDREELRRRIRSEDPIPLRTLRPEAGAELEEVVSRILRKDPRDRISSGRVLASSLREAIRPRPSSPAGLPSFAGLRSPAGRRMAVAAGAVLLVLLTAGVLITRQNPRLVEARGFAGSAFTAHGQVMVADFDAPEGLEELALATREALVVDLQQSGFVRVVPRSRVEGALQRMGYPMDAIVQGSMAREVAERVGAGAVLETTVARAGSGYLLSGRALDPVTGDELFAVRTSGGERRLLGAVERLSREMRRRLGEAAESLAESRPLPEVTTASLEALRHLAQAERYLATDLARAVRSLESALELDPEFAMAHRLAAAAGVSQLRYGDARHHIQLAWEHRDRLPDRERWHVEAVRASEVDFLPQRAEELYQRILARFPDDRIAAVNLGNVRLNWLADPEGALTAFLRAMEIDGEDPRTAHVAAQTALMLNRPDQADALMAEASSPEAESLRLRWRALRAFWAEDLEAMGIACEEILAAGLPPQPGADDRDLCGSLELAMGAPHRARPLLEAALQDHSGQGRQRHMAHVTQALATADLLEGDTLRARSRLLELMDHLPADELVEPDRYITRTNLRIQSALFGWDEVLERAARQYPPWPDEEHLLSRGGESLVRAAAALRRGEGETALAELEGAFPVGVMAIGWRTFDELFRGYAFEILGEPEPALTHFRRADNRGWAGLAAMTKDRMNIPLAREGLERVLLASPVTAGERAEDR